MAPTQTTAGTPLVSSLKWTISLPPPNVCHLLEPTNLKGSSIQSKAYQLNKSFQVFLSLYSSPSPPSLLHAYPTAVFNSTLSWGFIGFRSPNVFHVFRLLVRHLQSKALHLFLPPTTCTLRLCNLHGSQDLGQNIIFLKFLLMYSFFFVYSPSYSIPKTSISCCTVPLHALLGLPVGLLPGVFISPLFSALIFT